MWSVRLREHGRGRKPGEEGTRAAQDARRVVWDRVVGGRGYRPVRVPGTVLGRAHGGPGDSERGRV